MDLCGDGFCSLSFFSGFCVHIGLVGILSGLVVSLGMLASI